MVLIWYASGSSRIISSEEPARTWLHGPAQLKTNPTSDSVRKGGERPGKVAFLRNSSALEVSYSDNSVKRRKE